MATATRSKPKTERLQEYADSRGVALTVDADNGVIKGVKILGLNSKNGRQYSEEAARRAIGLYEGAKVNVNHSAKPGEPRQYESRMGQIKNVRQGSDGGLFGDFHFNPKHQLAEQLKWDAANAPENVGFSHNVNAKTSHNGRGVMVEDITQVHSVDLVADPATTKSLFESEQMKTTIKQIAESCGCEWFRKLLQEEGMGAMADMPVDAAPDASADDQIKSAFRAMVVAAFDDDSLDSKATLAKIKDILNAQEKLMAKPEKKEAPAEGGGEDSKATEALRSELNTLKEQIAARDLDDGIRKQLREAKVENVSEAFFNSLRKADEKDRKALIEERRGELSRPQSRGAYERITEGEFKGSLAKAY